MRDRVFEAEPPLDPDEETAREWLIDELSKGEYQSAKPTLLDQMVGWFNDWLNSLFSDVPGAPADLTGLVVVVILVVIVIVLAIIIGKPAAARRGASSKHRDVFLDDDVRSAAELRAAADAAARSGDWPLAITERFRAIARDLGDRTLIVLRPGSTAHDVARRAAAPFPAEAQALEQAARDFDEVRYLGRAGSEEAWRRTRDLDERLVSTRPAQITEFQDSIA